MNTPILKKIAKAVKSKSLIGAVLFALALWGYTQLNGTFVTRVDVPLIINLPENRAVENNIVDTVSVEARGTGWNLFTLQLFNSSARCFVDLSKKEVLDSVYTIPRGALMKSVEYFINVDPIDIIPESILLKTGAISTQKVSVRPDVGMTAREGFVCSQTVRSVPDSVEIRGADKLVGRIKELRTEYYEVEDAHGPFSAVVPLRDVGAFTMTPKKVVLYFDVQQVAEIVVEDVVIKVRGGAPPRHHRFMPQRLSVILRGGVDRLVDISPDEISASVGYGQIMKDSTGVIIPKITIPKGVELLRIEPKYVYHFKYSPQFKLSRL